MSRTKHLKVIAATLLALCLAALSVFTLTLTAHAENENYYICYESDNYRVRSSNLMTADGGVYTVTPTLTRGERFLVGDGNGHLWGGASGEPVVITESGSIRYKVTFSPSGFEGGGYIKLDYYTPETFFISVGETKTQMTYLKARPDYEEYYAYIDCVGGEAVCVEDGDGNVYGEKGIGESGITVALPGKYRFTFTADEDHLYGDDCYIAFSEYPAIYLLCEENGFEKDENYIMERDEDVVAYAQYTALIQVPKKDFDLRYAVYDAEKDETFKPSESGKITVKDKGEYEVHYSPEHAYSASGDELRYVELERAEQFYDGYFVLGDFNGFTYFDDDEFENLYKMVKDDEVTGYDEYKLNLKITPEMLREFEDKVEFYITDGRDIYRRLGGGNIAVTEAGEYELVFSPTHDYGHGLRYRYTRIGEGQERETITIYNARQFADMLFGLKSPEDSLGKTYLLATDIDLSEIDYTPGLIFAGELDGMYRTVKGVRDRGDNINYLFREVTADGVIRRLSFEVNIDSNARNTSLIGTNNGLVEEVDVVGTVKGDGYVGAVAAVNSSGGKLRECRSGAIVSGVMNVGGIVGFNAGSVRGCTFDGTVNAVALGASDSSSMLNLGGIAGYSTGNILSSVNSGKVGSRQGRYVGGIVGLTSGGLFACENKGDVSGANYTGGIAGYYGRFDSNTDSGTNNDLLDYLTGGRYEQWLDEYFGTNGDFEEGTDSGVHEVYYCISSGSIISDGYGGGIAAHAGATSLKIVGCISDAVVDVRYSYAGGIVGELGEGEVESCLSFGDVTAGGNHAGGIVGGAQGAVRNCQSSSYVKATDYVGGIVGEGGAVTGCVSYAFVETVESETRLGMIAGSADVGRSEYNYYLYGAEVGGIDGVSYGSENGYAAHALSPDKLMCTEMLSPELVGLDPDEWLAGESEPRYPTPRALAEMREPELYTDKAAFGAAYDKLREKLVSLADVGGRDIVLVTFYDYDFDAENYTRRESFRLRRHSGLGKEQIPVLEEEEGYFVRWDREDFSAFAEDTQVFELYDRVVTTLASDTEASPKVLVEGKFHSDTKLCLEYNGEYISLKFMRGDTEVSYGDVTVKYRVTDTERYGINLVHGMEIVDAGATAVGDYLSFTLSEGWAFAAVDKSSSLFPLWITLAAVGAAAVVALAFGVPLAVIRYRRKKKSSLSAEKAEHAPQTETNAPQTEVGAASEKEHKE